MRSKFVVFLFGIALGLAIGAAATAAWYLPTAPADSVNSDGISHTVTSPVVDAVKTVEGTFQINGLDVQQAVGETFPDIVGGAVIADGIYYTAPLGAFNTFLQQDDLDQHAYLADRFDCDDFAVGLKARAAEYGITLGMIIVPKDGAAHAVNVFIARENGKVRLYIVEPQSDEVRVPTVADKEASWGIF
jgi:hypothetical protein